jgi:hypothetical protein
MVMEELLDYNNELGWHSFKDGCLSMQMTDATFQRHVEAYLREQGIRDPTHEQRIQARQHCRRLSFWEGRSDPEIYRRRQSE